MPRSADTAAAAVTAPTPHDAAAAIHARAGSFAPKAALVLGSGLGSIADGIAEPLAIDYGAIPGFPRPSVEGHAGRLVLGDFGGTPVACLQGRVHLFEGAAAGDIKVLIRALKLLGCEIIVLTSAAGSLRREVAAESLMMITDHINLQGFNPLVGPNEHEFGPRFPAMEGAYDVALQGRLREAAVAAGIALHDGVYLAVSGPTFETPAEVRAFHKLGADAVGMSTVPEVIVARHCGLRVAAISAIVNAAVGLGGAPLSHEQTLEVARRCAGDMQRLLAAFFKGVADAQ